MDLQECFKKGLIKKTIPNQELISSLKEMADIKEMTVNEANINEKNISAYVSLAYDALREILEAVAVLNGFKVLSHICLGELLKEFDYEEFDRIRWIRNSINYYGHKIDFDQGKEIIKKIFHMKKTIVENYLKPF